MDPVSYTHLDVYKRQVLKVSEIPLDYSSIAQLVEHAAVNRAVVGSSPTRGVFFMKE